MRVTKKHKKKRNIDETEIKVNEEKEENKPKTKKKVKEVPSKEVKQNRKNNIVLTILSLLLFAAALSFGYICLIYSDLRKDNKIFFIDKDILETKFEEKYPCILAEKNIYEMASKWRHFKLYSDHNTYFKLFENIGVKNG